jgi:hypothetical protein
MNRPSDFVDRANHSDGGLASVGGMMHGYDKSTMQFRNAPRHGVFLEPLERGRLAR